MSYQEKSSILSIICFPLTYAGYWIYVLQKLKGDAQALLNDLSFWAVAILIVIGISIVARIVLEILFNVANAVVTRGEEISTMEDERDRLFELKSNRVSAFVVSFGFLLSLATLALKWPAYVMINILFFAFNLSVVTSEIVKLRYYRSGM